MSEKTKTVVTVVPFRLSGHPAGVCSNPLSHPPHPAKYYQTVRNGWGAYMCPGIPGELPGGGRLEIRFGRGKAGSPEEFASMTGEYEVSGVAICDPDGEEPCRAALWSTTGTESPRLRDWATCPICGRRWRGDDTSSPRWRLVQPWP